MLTVRNCLFLVLAVLSLSACRQATDSGSSELEAQVDAFFAGIDPQASPGAAVVVVKNGKLVLKKSYGLANIEHAAPITSETVFDIASLSKQFTGYAIAKLVAAGKISLQDDVRKYIPELPEYGAAITIQHLVHHTSGVPDWPYYFRTAGVDLQGDVISFDQILGHIYRQRSLEFAPGSRYQYSNAGYNLLAEVVARVSGQPFHQWMAQNVFEPLGMRHSQVRPDHRRLIENSANCYFVEDGSIKTAADQLTAYGSSSIFSTIDDLILWVDAFDSGRLDDLAVLAAMHARGKLNDGTQIPYAFGVGVADYRGLQLVAHNGAWLAYTSTIMRFPEHRAAVIVLSNASNVVAFEIGRKIADLLLADDFPQPPPVKQLSQTAAEASGDWDPKTLADFAGSYGLDEIPGFVLTVRNDGDRLMVALGSEAELPGVRQAAAVFALPGANSTITFHRNDAGSVDGLTFRRGAEYIAHRIEPYTPQRGELAQFEGRFYSPEVAATYTFTQRDGTLYASHPRAGSFALKAIGPDEFGNGPSYFAGVRFKRDRTGSVTHAMVFAEGVRGLAFDKVPGL